MAIFLTFFILALVLGAFLYRARWRRKGGDSISMGPGAARRFALELPGWEGLPPAMREKHLALCAGFLEHKSFEACGGAVLTPATREKIAGVACLLWLRLDPPAYPRLRTVLVYPGDFKSSRRRELSGGAWTEEDEVRSGESWDQGCVVLAGPHRRDGALVVAHEFAHQLDGHDGNGTDGNPPLPDLPTLRRWEREWPGEFAALEKAWERGEGWLDDYALENRAEFFAVAVEEFLYYGRRLRRARPGLYALLADYFGLDTASA